MVNQRFLSKVKILISKYKKSKIISVILMLMFLTVIVFSGCYKSEPQSSSTSGSQNSGISESQSSSISESLNSGITGITLIGPLRPVEQISEVNQAPYPDAVIIIKNRISNEEIKRVSVDKNGYFKIPLPPGDYILDAKNKTGNVLPISKPIDITVSPDKFTDITVIFDSGIR